MKWESPDGDSTCSRSGGSPRTCGIGAASITGKTKAVPSVAKPWYAVSHYYIYTRLFHTQGRISSWLALFIVDDWTSLLGIVILPKYFFGSLVFFIKPPRGNAPVLEWLFSSFTRKDLFPNHQYSKSAYVSCEVHVVFSFRTEPLMRGGQQKKWWCVHWCVVL